MTKFNTAPMTSTTMPLGIPIAFIKVARLYRGKTYIQTEVPVK